MTYRGVPRIAHQTATTTGDKATLTRLFSTTAPGWALFAYLVLALTVPSHAQTPVSGPIRNDTVWSRDQSPYIVTDDVTLAAGAMLIIEPGVVIKVAPETNIKIDGLLIARGDEGRPITFTKLGEEPWGILHFTDFSDDAVVDDNLNYVSGSVLELCVFEGGKGIFCLYGSPLIAKCVIRRNVSSGIRVEHGGPLIRDNHIYENSTKTDPASGNGAGIIAYTDKAMVIIDNVVEKNESVNGRYGGGGICAYATGNQTIIIRNNSVLDNSSSTHAGGLFAFRCLVENNLVAGNRSEQNGGGIYVIESQVRGNIVDSNVGNGGGGVYAEQSELSFNSVVNNRSGSSYGGGIFFFGSGDMRYNTVIHNSSGDASRSGGLYVSGNPRINDNTICANDGYDLYTGNPLKSPALDARRNYWGAPGEDAIVSAVYDWFDDAERGLVDSSDQFVARVPQAPLPAPVGIRAVARGPNIRVQWDPSPGGDVDGYVVHYGATSSSRYGGTTVDAGSKTSYNITGLPAGAYFVAVSARRAGGTTRADQSAISERLTITLPKVSRQSLAPPSNLSPPKRKSDVALRVRLKARAFPKSRGEQAASRWQITTIAGDYRTPVFDSGPSTGGAHSMEAPKGALQNGTHYFWRVSYRGPEGGWSPWSAETSFVTTMKTESIVSGPIRGTSRWTRASSPYIVTGNALVVEGATLSIEPGVTIRMAPNVSFMVRGAIVAVGAADAPVTFTKNGEEPWGQLIFADPSADALFAHDGAYREGCILKRCVVEHGKGILIEAASPFLTESIIRRHEASGLTIRKGGPIVSGNEITENTSAQEGGGIYVYTNDLTKIRGNVIKGNRARASGGGIFAYGYRSTTSIVIADNEISGNTSSANGGGVYVSRTIFAGNTLFNNRAAELGGGVYTTFSIVDRNTVSMNTAYKGGGIFSERNSTIRHNTVTANSSSSSHGGGVYVNYWGASFENEVFSYNRVTCNTAGSPGENGGVYVAGALIFENNDIFDNLGYELYNGNDSGEPPLEAKGCFWGTVDPEAIEKEVFHHVDDDRLATVSFAPFVAEEPNASRESTKTPANR